MTNENRQYYQDAYEIGAEKIIDTYAERHNISIGLITDIILFGWSHNKGY